MSDPGRGSRRRRKGVFAAPGLPVAGGYPGVASRRWMWGIALLLAAGVGAAFVIDLTVGDADWVANGPLSSAHAMLDSDCGACHEASAVSEERCSVCHEKHGDRLGVYSFAAHAVYRSADFGRIAEPEHPVACDGCHLEHRGREAEITAVADARCARCHDFGALAEHPQFEVLEQGGEERGGLEFPHILHVSEVMQRQQLVDLERACLYCHTARADGRSFEPISFDRHCDTCHLTATQSTPELPVRPPGSTLEAAEGPIGVETLESLLERRPPGSLWTLTANPREYRVVDGTVTKTPLYHRDPWLLENLRQLRQVQYPNAELADLLIASPDAEAYQITELYREAVSTLRDYALELRAEPDRSVQRDLRQIEALLDEVERALEDPATPLDEGRFLLELLEPDPALGAERKAEMDRLVELLTEPCRQCHSVERATIARVAADQRTLRRAEFDHRAHIIQRRCLDCHDRIPFEERLPLAEQGKEALLDAAVDRAAIVNLPGIATCRECHRRDAVAERCATCHYYHPNKSRRSELLLYLAP